MVDGNTASSSHHEQVQAITVLRSGKTMDNKVAEKKDEQASLPKDPTPVKDKGQFKMS
jgi:hypothetical protein